MNEPYDHEAEEPDGIDIEDDIVENIPASVLSDIKRIDGAIDYIAKQCDAAENPNAAWKAAEPILDALGDARTGLLDLVERWNADKVESVHLTGRQVELGRKFREVMELQGFEDILYGLTAGLDQYRVDYILGPDGMIKMQAAIIALLKAALA